MTQYFGHEKACQKNRGFDKINSRKKRVRWRVSLT